MLSKNLENSLNVLFKECSENLDEFVGIGKQKTSKSKVTLPESLDDFADGGLAGLLGE